MAVSSFGFWGLRAGPMSGESDVIRSNKRENRQPGFRFVMLAPSKNKERREVPAALEFLSDRREPHAA
jgi:hypothetical protein